MTPLKRSHARLVSWLAATLLWTASSGCSALLITRAPDAVDEGRDLDCTDNYAAPVLDTVVWVTSVAVGAYELSAHSGQNASVPAAGWVGPSPGMGTQ